MFAKLRSIGTKIASGVKAGIGKAQAFAVTLVTGVGATLGLGQTEAHAEVPAIVGTTVTGLIADAGSIFTTVFPYAAAVLGFVVVLKLFKRFVNKA